MKKFLSMVMASFLTVSTVALAGCSLGGGEKGDVTLNVYVLNAGYDIKWLDGIKESFVQEPWVVEKYGKVALDIEENGLSSYAADKIKAGSSKANKFDLLFSLNLQDLYGKAGNNKQYYLADLKDVYEATVPGESITVKDKMVESAVTANMYTNSKGKSSWYALPWAGGYNGILYNADKLQADGYTVPVTTDELLDIMEAETAENGYSVMQSMKTGESSATYWEHLFPTWWAQYEGYENYTKFWEGKLYNEEKKTYEYSVDIFKQQGRLESLKVLEDILEDNLYKKALATEYLVAQRMLLKGEGMFMACGDWYDMEMEEIKQDIVAHGEKVYNIQMMKTPVVSSIINKLTTVKDDATLAAVIRAIDNGATSYTGVSETDFKVIKEAREILYSVGNYHTAVIPSYAKNIDLAKDFLKYMATDKANEIYTEKTGGSGLFFKYNVQEKNPTLYNSLSNTAKMRINCFNDPSALVLPIPNNYNLFIYGKVRNFTTNFSSYEYLFTQTETSAQDLYDDDIKYYTTSEWNTILATIGAI